MRYREAAVFTTLDWIEEHRGKMSETLRGTLTFSVPDVISWLESASRSTSGVLAAAHVVAPYPYQIKTHDTAIWLPALNALHKSGNHVEATYLRTLLLALAFCNAASAPLDLIGMNFEIVHERAELSQLRDDAWMILQPLVPELHWWNSWDTCERMRRHLIWCFMEYSWPEWELMERIKDRRILHEILKSGRDVRGSDSYFRNVYRQFYG